MIIATVHLWRGCGFPGALWYNLDVFGRIDNFSTLPFSLCNFLDPFLYHSFPFSWLLLHVSAAIPVHYKNLHDGQHLANISEIFIASPLPTFFTAHLVMAIIPEKEARCVSCITLFHRKHPGQPDVTILSTSRRQN